MRDQEHGYRPPTPCPKCVDGVCDFDCLPDATEAEKQEARELFSALRAGLQTLPRPPFSRVGDEVTPAMVRQRVSQVAAGLLTKTNSTKRH